METIKEEKKADLEQLLNSLIEKGWEPFGVEGIKKVEYSTWVVERGENKIPRIGWRFNFTNGVAVYPDGSGEWIYHTESLRDIVSSYSGLWQFVCENRLVEYIDCAYCKYIQNDEEIWYETQSNDYQYRLIESSLKDESELEDFLLNSIKLD